MLPRISIVTPTLNRAAFLAEAIESVRAQGYENYEHIVVDGLSNDGTAELLARHPELRVIRESDAGMYDALNKGLRAATGEIIGHLNSDDLYAPGAFAAVAKAFSDRQIETVCGGVEIFEDAPPVPRRVLWRYHTPAQLALSFHNLTLGAPLTNARFFRKSVYAAVGWTDDRFRIAADRDFLLRVALTAPREAFVEATVYHYRVHPDALTFTHAETHRQREHAEYIAIAERFLARPNLPPAARAALLAWHGNYSVFATLSALVGMRWKTAFDVAVSAQQARPGWPAALGRGVWRSIQTRLRKTAAPAERQALEL